MRAYVVYWWMGKDVGATLARKRRSGQHVVLSCDDDSSELGLSNFSDVGLQFLADGCPRLEKLCLIWCSAVTSFGLDILAQACRGLKVLDMQVCDLKVLWVLDLIQFDVCMFLIGLSKVYCNTLCFSHRKHSSLLLAMHIALYVFTNTRVHLSMLTTTPVLTNPPQGL